MLMGYVVKDLLVSPGETKKVTMSVRKEIADDTLVYIDGSSLRVKGLAIEDGIAYVKDRRVTTVLVNNYKLSVRLTQGTALMNLVVYPHDVYVVDEEMHVEVHTNQAAKLDEDISKLRVKTGYWLSYRNFVR